MLLVVPSSAPSTRTPPRGGAELVAVFEANVLAGANSVCDVFEGATVGVLPIYFQPGDDAASLFAPSWASGSEIARLLAGTPWAESTDGGS